MKSINYIHERGNIPTSLSSIPFFSRLRPSCLDEVLEHAGILEVEPGEAVVSEGERSHSLYFLLDGALKVYKDGSAVADIARPGELFGEISYITKEPHGATVKAERRSTVFRIESALTRTLSDANLDHFESVLYRFLTELLAARVVATSKRVGSSGRAGLSSAGEPDVYQL